MTLLPALFLYAAAITVALIATSIYSITRRRWPINPVIASYWVLTTYKCGLPENVSAWYSTT